MSNFKNDYSQCAHPAILEALARFGTETNCAYGGDTHSAAAEDIIRKLCKSPKAQVAFISGGTTTNALAISALLRNGYEAVISAETGHINVHETGAIEYAGHKVLTVKTGVDGKLTPELIAPVVEFHTDEFMVKPKLVYVSQSTERGAIYSKAELTAISEYCREKGLYLFLDGARLGSALMAKENDLTLADIASLVDAFYIGGTKNGLLFGEALVMINEDMKDHIRWMIKQKGFMLAKGFVVGMMFEEALKDGLFFDIAKHGNEAAEKIAEAIEKSAFGFYVKPQTNQLFVTLPELYAYEAVSLFDCNIEKKLDGGLSVIRIVTSWATTDDDVKEICEWIESKNVSGVVKSILKS